MISSLRMSNRHRITKHVTMTGSINVLSSLSEKKFGYSPPISIPNAPAKSLIGNALDPILLLKGLEPKPTDYSFLNLSKYILYSMFLSWNPISPTPLLAVSKNLRLQLSPKKILNMKLKKSLIQSLFAKVYSTLSNGKDTLFRTIHGNPFLTSQMLRN